MFIKYHSLLTPPTALWIIRSWLANILILLPLYNSVSSFINKLPGGKYAFNGRPQSNVHWRCNSRKKHKQKPPVNMLLYSFLIIILHMACWGIFKDSLYWRRPHLWHVYDVAYQNSFKNYCWVSLFIFYITYFL